MIVIAGLIAALIIIVGFRLLAVVIRDINKWDKP